MQVQAQHSMRAKHLTVSEAYMEVSQSVLHRTTVTYVYHYSIKRFQETYTFE